MKVLVMVKATAAAHSDMAAAKKEAIEMDAFNDALEKAGVRLAAHGLHNNNRCVRVHFDGIQKTLSMAHLPRPRNWSSASGSGRSNPWPKPLTGSSAARSQKAMLTCARSMARMTLLRKRFQTASCHHLDREHQKLKSVVTKD